MTYGDGICSAIFGQNLKLCLALFPINTFGAVV